ncbi:hypothetical protein E2P64_08345 [Candidatus Bathyarchaeota archaeon]|nr:hypothetical protein E2P64_08345 [Candidatus Bathyarchaeota archaeon]
MKRKWKWQPRGKNQCGQVAVAVIAGISLEESIAVVGKRGCTRTKDLVRALRLMGYECPDRCKKMPRPKLGLGQVRDSTKRSGWHWVVVDGDKIFDGAFGERDGTVTWPIDPNGLRWRITSYLPITECSRGSNG